MTIPREEAVIREGWLLKEGGASKSRWQSRWFILKGRTLSWYNKAEDSSPQGSVAMADVQDVSQIGRTLEQEILHQSGDHQSQFEEGVLSRRRDGEPHAGVVRRAAVAVARGTRRAG